ncbi:MAG: SPOR domain-containing protein [Gulosibacter sp.]|uniref:SPOR domain-containing protein n=1 Tax=Gulosibacter sp. TaxID=2817531 RepID=UPI003F92CCA7
MTEKPEDEFWYNTRTGEVERGKQSIALDRIGPFATEAEAARANERLAENAQRWAAEEAREAEENGY